MSLHADFKISVSEREEHRRVADLFESGVAKKNLSTIKAQKA